MAKARSKIQTVLRVKKHQEKVAHQQLMQIKDEHQREQERLSHLHHAKDEAVKGVVRFGRAKATDVQTQRAFIIKLSKQITRQAHRVNEIQEKENEKLVELTKRAQSRQMVEKLDERQRKEIDRRVDKKEQETIDEVASRTKAT